MDNHYKLILQRIDNYISSVNTKGSLIVAFNTFLCGSIVAKYSELKPIIESSGHTELVNSLLIALLLISIISVFVVGLAIFPFLKSGNSSAKKYHSHIFFNSIADFKSEDQFLNSCTEYNSEEASDDLKRQVYILSLGLKKKFKKIGLAMWLFFVNLILLLLITILIIF